ncbi:hypothetical protein LTR66_002299, partial [Elasticomyces elasticus]
SGEPRYLKSDPGKAWEAGVLGTQQTEGGEDLSPTGQRHDNDLCDDPASTQGHETRAAARPKEGSRAWRTWFQPSTYKFEATGHRCAFTQREEDKKTEGQRKYRSSERESLERGGQRLRLRRRHPTRHDEEV